jgi:predicted metal-dependent phosphoesterase TrpH
MTIDLHTHSVFSDGTDTPASLLRAAQAAGVDTVAITDHDTTASWRPAAEALPPGMTLLRGTELSTHVVAGRRRRSIHLLAYLFDAADPAMDAELTRLRADRMDRGMVMVGKMVADGVPISRTQVTDIARGAPIGRPHIGRALVAAGLVATVSEAFATYLSARGPYYVSKADTALDDAIALVRGAGGVPVMAHPRSRGAASVTDAAMVAHAAGLGLAGIEVDHPDHSATDRAELREIAGRLGLVTTGSSDYHGTNKALRIGQDVTAPEALDRIVALSSGVTGLIAA